MFWCLALSNTLVMLMQTSSVASIGDFQPCSSRDDIACENTAMFEDHDWDSGHPLNLQHPHHQHGEAQQEEEDCMHKAGSGDHASLPGWNTARDLLLEQQKTSKEEAIPPQGKAGNPFARSKPKVSMLVKAISQADFSMTHSRTTLTNIPGQCLMVTVVDQEKGLE